MKFVRVIQNIIEVIFLLFCGFLAVSSLFVHGAMNFETYEEKITLEFRNPLAAILETVLFILVLLAVGRLIASGIRDDKGSEKIRRRSIAVGAVMVILIAAGGLLWIHANPYPPYSDQKKVWDAAVALAEGDPDGIDLAYFWIYPHQKKMAVVFSPIAWLLGGDPVFSIRAVNVAAAVFLTAGILVLCKDVRVGCESPKMGNRQELSASKRFKGKECAEAGGEGGGSAASRKERNKTENLLRNRVVGALLCILFTPIVIYTCFVYGTLLFAAASVWSFHGILRLDQTGKLRYGILPLLLFPFANLCYSSARIAIVAGAVTLLLPVFIRKPTGTDSDTVNFHHEPILFRIVLAAGIVILTLAAEKGADAIFNRVSGLSGGDSFPYAQYLYMGITSPEEEAVVGPGSFVNGGIGSNWNGSNAEEVNAEYRAKTMEALQDYLHHRRSLRFFVRKTWYQWLDPWFSSLTMTFSLWMRDIEIPDALRNFMTGRPVRWMQHLLTILMSTVYLMAFWNAVSGFHRRWKKRTIQTEKKTYIGKDISADAPKEINAGRKGSWCRETQWCGDASFLLEIYFIGGFVFQLFWESKARYCFPYFLCLFPMAAEGVGRISDLLPYWRDRILTARDRREDHAECLCRDGGTGK